jgi:anti-sigma28 factor (negative regulator of flagellin synthesis)
MKTSDTKPVRPFEKVDGPVVPKKEAATQEPAEVASVRASNGSVSTVSQAVDASKSAATQSRTARVETLAQEYANGNVSDYSPVDLAKAISDDAEMTAKLSSLLLG